MDKALQNDGLPAAEGPYADLLRIEGKRHVDGIELGDGGKAFVFNYGYLRFAVFAVLIKGAHDGRAGRDGGKAAVCIDPHNVRIGGSPCEFGAGNELAVKAHAQLLARAHAEQGQRHGGGDELKRLITGGGILPFDIGTGGRRGAGKQKHRGYDQ